MALRKTQILYVESLSSFGGKGFRYKRDDVCDRGLVLLHLQIKVFQDPLKNRKYDIRESIDFRGEAGFRDVERGLCLSGTSCTIRATGEIASH